MEDSDNDNDNNNSNHDISSQYLDNEQIKVYLEACLDHKILNFKVNNDKEGIYDELYKKEVFEKMKEKKKIPNQDNLFYRVWVYQYEGLKDILSKTESLMQLTMNKNIDNFGNLKENLIDEPKLKSKENKSLKFKFTFGKIDIKDLQTQNLLYKKHTSNHYYNFDEFKPSDNEITEQKTDLNIIFLYVNLGTPTLEDEYEAEKEQNLFTQSIKKKCHYKYEFEAERIVYFKTISFALDDREYECANPTCNMLLNTSYDQSIVYWSVIEDNDKDNISIKTICSKCMHEDKEMAAKKIVDCSQYSIRYFWHCQVHTLKRYEFYCKDCNKAFCVDCLNGVHKSFNKTHWMCDLESMDCNIYQSYCKEKKDRINKLKKRNKLIWNEIDKAGDNAEISLRERESNAINLVKQEVLARCIYLASIGYELQRMISEIDSKKKLIEDLRKDSNISTYLNMNNQFDKEMKENYLPNLENIEKMPLEKYLDTFHKIEKKYPIQKK